MEEILRKFGYKNDLHNSEWRKSNWTVRFGLSEVEAFDTPRLNIPGMYYKKNIKDLDLEFLLNEIEQYIK